MWLSKVRHMVPYMVEGYWYSYYEEKLAELGKLTV
jgi:hypothetical protein